MRRAATAIVIALFPLACSASPLSEPSSDESSPPSASSSSGGSLGDDAGPSATQSNPPTSGSSSGGGGGGGGGGSGGSSPISSPGADAGAASGSGSSGGSSSSSSSSSSGGGGTGSSSGGPSGDDAGSSAPPRNGSCTPLSDQTGTAADTTHGRMDGTLVYILPIDGSSSCNGDDAHVHLQIELSGSVYDVAVDVGKSGDEVGWYQKTIAPPGGTWSEGWHGSDDLGYSSLGLTSSDFTTLDPAAIGGEVESLLASTSKISIYCTGYTPGDNGCHDVHYQDGSSQDGAIVLDPTAATSPVLFFRFTDQSF